VRFNILPDTQQGVNDRKNYGTKRKASCAERLRLKTHVPKTGAGFRPRVSSA